jgi:homoserine kinase
VQELKGQGGILGSALSGAGPSVLIFVDPRAAMSKVRKLVSQQLFKHGLAAELISTAITLRGARG